MNMDFGHRPLFLPFLFETVCNSVAKPPNFYAAPVPTLLYSKAKFLKQTEV
jgi:hypothetical protein